MVNQCLLACLMRRGQRLQEDLSYSNHALSLGFFLRMLMPTRLSRCYVLTVVALKP
jgi:hypothetical protein